LIIVKKTFSQLSINPLDAISKYSKVLAVDLRDRTSGFTIFPNPANSVAKLQWNSPDEKDIAIRVVDHMGRIVISLISPRENFASLSVDQLPDGVYRVLFFSKHELKNSTMMVVKR